LILAEALRPDIMLTDMDMPGTNGIEVARILRALVPNTRVMIVTMYEIAHHIL
jgi:DNA-binding NarL/FixJ family response regulator